MTEVDTAAPAEPTNDQVTPSATDAPPAPLPNGPEGFPEKTPLANMSEEQTVAYWQHKARKHEEQAKANADKAKAYDALEESKKTELQKANERAAAAEKAYADKEAELLRVKIAAEGNVPANLIAGSSEDEMRESLAALLAFKGVAPAVPDATGSGAVGRPISGVKQVTEAEFAVMTLPEIQKARVEGRLVKILGQGG